MGHSKLEDELKPLRSTGESPELQGTGHIASPNLSINTITTKGAFKFLPKQTDPLLHPATLKLSSTSTLLLGGFHG